MGNFKVVSLYVWIYCFICFLIQDVVKVIAYRTLKKYNLFGVNDGAKLLGNAERVANSV